MRNAQAKWLELWRRLQLKGDPLPVFGELAAKYQESHRAYHNLDHIQQCLVEFEPARGLAKDPDSVELAIWFHDAIYDPRRKDNEEQSAEVFKKIFSPAGLRMESIEKVASLILVTKHDSVPSEQDAQILVDVDLSILGASPNRFFLYESQIRQEYNWVPDKTFTEGRSAILQKFLARPFIFLTKFFREKYETQARKNMEASLQSLKLVS